MRLLKSLLIISVTVLCLSACNRKYAASRINGSKGFDVASFNYVYVEALKQKIMGNAGDALKYLEQCIKINPHSDAAYYQVAQIVSANGDIKNGERYLLKALNIDDKNVWYLTMLAGLYYQEKNLDSAILWYEKAVKYFPENNNLELTLGNLYSENSDLEKADYIFGELETKYGINEKSTVFYIKNLIAEKKFDEAKTKTLLLLKEFPEEIGYMGILADICRAKGERQQALDIYSKMLENYPDNGHIQLSLCDFFITEKLYDDLFSFINKLLLNGGISAENKVAIMARIIEIPELIKTWDKNIIISLMVLEANYKDNNIIPLLRPEYYIRKGNLDEAAVKLEEILKSNPENYFAWEKLLFVLLEMKNYSRLMLKGGECATKFNTSFPAKILFANGAMESKNYSIALEELKKAEILAGDNREFLIQVLSLRADVYYRMKNYPKAFETFQIALKADNNDLTVINNYAYYLAEQNYKLKEAEEMAKRVVEKEKTNTTFLDTYGWILFKRGKLQEAEKVFESIIRNGGKTDPVIYEHYGYILKKKGKCDEAVINWNIALKLDSTRSELLKEIKDCEK